MSSSSRDLLLSGKPATSSYSPAPGLQLLLPASPHVVIVERLLDPVVPLSESLVHGDVADGDPGKGADAGAALEHGGETDTTETSAVVLPIRGRTAEVGAEGGIRVGQEHLLHLLHRQVQVEVAGDTDSQTLHQLIDKYLLGFPAALSEDFDAKVRSPAGGYHRLQATQERLKGVGAVAGVVVSGAGVERKVGEHWNKRN